MAWVDGGTLADRLAGGKPLPLDQTADVLEEMAGALDYAHQHGIVHRDVEPSNILLSRDGRVILGDFGLAKDMGGEDSTVAGMRSGSPAYMAPEQVWGEQPLGPWTDVYALGLVLYEMLTGAKPFEGPLIVVAQKQIEEPPPPLASRNPDLPPALEPVVDRALEKDPAKRYQSAGELNSAFQNALSFSEASGGFVVPPAVTSEHTARRRRSSCGRTLLAVLAGCFLALALFTALVIYLGNAEQVFSLGDDGRERLLTRLPEGMIEWLMPATVESPDPTVTPTEVATQAPSPSPTTVPTSTPTPTPTLGVPLVLAGPPHGESFDAGQPISLTWEQVPLEEGQRLRVALRNEEQGTSALTDGRVAPNANSYDLPDLPPGTYTWMVISEERANNFWNPLSLSEIRTFAVVSAEPTEMAMPPSPSPSAELTGTSSPSPVVFPTVPPALVATETATPEPTPTFTLTRTATPTLKSTSTPTLAPTSTPRLPPTSTPTLRPTSTPTPIPPDPLAESPSGTVVTQGAEVPFIWAWDGELTRDQAFELRLWHDGDGSHFGAFDARELERYVERLPGAKYAASLGLDDAYSIKLHGSGDYLWSIAVVQLDPYTDLGLESAPLLIRYER